MNITSGATTFGTWDRRKLQHLLTACIAGLAVSVAVAVGVTNLSEPSNSSSRSPAIPAARSVQSLPTYFYLVDSQEKANLVGQAENEMAVAAAQYGIVPDHYSTVIDVSTAEGQQLLESLNAEAAGLPDFQFNARFIDWTE